MNTFDNTINASWDLRVATLGRIKAHSLEADTLTLTALTVLTYAQLEGGIKDFAACVIKHINARSIELKDISPFLLNWRNSEEIERFKTLVNFEMVGSASPFAQVVNTPVKLRTIDRRYELNQMNSTALKAIYRGLRLQDAELCRSASGIDDLVEVRNEAAHQGVMPNTATRLLEAQVRGHVLTVENVLTDFAIQLLYFFPKKLHLRA